MKVHKLAWLGTRTDNPAATVAFFRSVLGLRVDHEEPDFVVLRLRDGAKVEVFGPGSPHNRHFTTGPVAGFLVDDVEAATAELVAAGVEIAQAPIHDPGGNAWVHLRGPDGNLYELTQDPRRMSRVPLNFGGGPMIVRPLPPPPEPRTTQ